MSNIDLENITFVIVTYKSNEILKKCLNYLPIESKKIIVENSKDNLFKIELENNYLNLRCYLTGSNLGYGVANNFGVKKSTTDYIFILNPDVEIEFQSINEILKILNNVNFDLAAPINLKEKNNYNFNNSEIIEVDYVKGFAMIMKKDFFLKYLFDENIFLYLEEIDLCKRIKKDNGKIILINSFVTHIGGNSHGNRLDLEMEKSRNWHWMWSKFYFYKKYNGYFYGIIKTFPNFLNCLIKYLLFKFFKKEERKNKYKMRVLGLLNSYLLKKSHYRPFNNN